MLQRLFATPRPIRRPALRAFRPRFEVLEDRSLLSTFTVLNLNDSGPGSLRQAVLDANATAEFDQIAFAPRLHGAIVLRRRVEYQREPDDSRPGRRPT